LVALPFGVPAPHESDGSGTALPVQVVPLEGAAQPTVVSALQTEVVVEPEWQQEPIASALPVAAPAPHVSVASVCAGVAPPVHVYPVEPEQLSDPSTAHEGVVVPGPAPPV